MPNLAKLDYIDRVNRAIDYVMRNLLPVYHVPAMSFSGATDGS